MNYPIKPHAKVERLVVQELSDEILIYNLETNKAFSLNQTTALVWQNCDGIKDVSQIAKEMGRKLKQNVPDELVLLAIDSLRKEGLIAGSETDSPVFSASNRREMLKRVGYASMIALPMISSLVAPTSASAASGVPAAVCANCSKRGDPCDPACGANALGTCYDNAGCGAGQVISVAGPESCSACKARICAGGVNTCSWKI